MALLTATAHYKRKEPTALEEAELVQNLFDCLISALAQPANQLLFLKAEGIELMILTIKERRFASHGALRALDAALAKNGANCERFVDIRGFKTLFPMLGTPAPPLPAFSSSKADKRSAQQTHDEACASILCTLFHQARKSSREQDPPARPRSTESNRSRVQNNKPAQSPCAIYVPVYPHQWHAHGYTHGAW